MSDRPVYIPSRKRKQKQFFHGAFTGGFSAGHFNTVADPEQEFVPKQDENAIRQQQKPEDFMDDQDHNEWGGPTSVREEYDAAPATVRKTSYDHSSKLEYLVQPPSQNVGHRLLRILGWRDGSTAYVPREEKETVLLTSEGQHQSVESLLSLKRLKKIQLQQSRVKIPSPKLDTGGLGYEPYENAPEFRAHRERRRKEAQERAKAVTASSAENRNVYRLSNLLDNNDEDDDKTRQFQSTNQEEDNPLVSYETEQSFVGTKTVGGFALREDDDDVYDDHDHAKACKINRDEYDTVVYEHASDEEDNHAKVNGSGEVTELGSVFASWATSKSGESNKPASRGVTSDGRPPLAGFVLGASTASKTVERYPGPDIPSGYEPKRHAFGKDEYPNAWRDKDSAQQELLEQRRKAIQQERKAEIRKMDKKRETGPMASAAFAGLAAAMKNRFTSETSENGAPTAIGLQRPIKAVSSVLLPDLQVPPPKPITITRTTMTFVPESLLCKRFHVVPPAHAKPTVGGKAAAEPRGEAAYFEKEIMSKAATSDAASSRAKKPEAKMSFDNDLDTAENPADTRPSMKVLESIFEPQSESSESEEEIEKTETATMGPKDQTGSASTVAAPPPGIPAPDKSSLVVHDDTKETERNRESESRKDKRRRSRDDGRKSRRRRRSRSRSPGSSSDRSRRKKRDEKKKRKKRHRSSRRSKGE